MGLACRNAAAETVNAGLQRTRCSVPAGADHVVLEEIEAGPLPHDERVGSVGGDVGGGLHQGGGGERTPGRIDHLTGGADPGGVDVRAGGTVPGVGPHDQVARADKGHGRGDLVAGGVRDGDAVGVEDGPVRPDPRPPDVVGPVPGVGPHDELVGPVGRDVGVELGAGHIADELLGPDRRIERDWIVRAGQDPVGNHEAQLVSLDGREPSKQFPAGGVLDHERAGIPGPATAGEREA